MCFGDVTDVDEERRSDRRNLTVEDKVREAVCSETSYSSRVREVFGEGTVYKSRENWKRYV